MFWKNMRQRNPVIANHPQVLAAKERFGRKKGVAKTASNRWGCPNFYLNAPEGEDERTTNMYKEKLIKEYEAFPTNRSVEAVDLYMSKTVHDRRRMVKEMCSVRSILSEYPILGEGDEVRLCIC